MLVNLYKDQIHHLKFKFRLLEKSNDEQSTDNWNVILEKEFFWDVFVQPQHGEQSNPIIKIENSADEADQHNLEDIFFSREIKSSHNIQRERNRSERDDPCHEVIVYVRISKSNRTTFQHFQVAILRFHLSSNVLEMLPVRSSLKSLQFFESYNKEQDLSILLDNGEGSLHKFTATILDEKESSDLDIVEHLLSKKRDDRFKTHIHLRYDRLLMLLQQKKDIQRMKTYQKEIFLEIISAEGYNYDNIRISYYILSPGWTVKPMNTEDSIENASKHYGFTHVSRCSFQRSTSVASKSLIVLLLGCSAVYILAFKVDVMQLIFLCSILFVICNEFIQGPLTGGVVHQNESTFASFFHSVPLVQVLSESDDHHHDHNPELLFVVSTCLENVNSIVGFSILRKQMQISHEHEVKLSTLMITSGPGMPERWATLQEFFFGSLITVQDIVHYLADGSYHISTRPSGSIKIRLIHQRHFVS